MGESADNGEMNMGTADVCRGAENSAATHSDSDSMWTVPDTREGDKHEVALAHEIQMMMSSLRAAVNHTHEIGRLARLMPAPPKTIGDTHFAIAARARELENTVTSRKRQFTAAREAILGPMK